MDIARGMSCLHSQKPPIIHRDLKTANLLVSARFEVKVRGAGWRRGPLRGPRDRGITGLIRRYVWAVKYEG